MTATVVSLFQTPEADQSQAVRDARLVLHSPIKQEARDLRTACHVLQTWGDTIDYMMARQMLLMLDRQDLRLPDPPPSAVMWFYAVAAAGGLVAVALFQALAWWLL